MIFNKQKDHELAWETPLEENAHSILKRKQKSRSQEGKV